MPLTRSQTSNQKKNNIPETHPKGWTKHLHYFNWGCYCGQSCPCCRAQVGDTLGACPICLNNKNK